MEIRARLITSIATDPTAMPIAFFIAGAGERQERRTKKPDEFHGRTFRKNRDSIAAYESGSGEPYLLTRQA